MTYFLLVTNCDWTLDKIGKLLTYYTVFYKKRNRFIFDSTLAILGRFL